MQAAACRRREGERARAALESSRKWGRVQSPANACCHTEAHALAMSLPCRSKRDTIYRALLRHMSSEHKFSTSAKLANEVQGRVCGMCACACMCMCMHSMCACVPVCGVCLVCMDPCESRVCVCVSLHLHSWVLIHACMSECLVFACPIRMSRGDVHVAFASVQGADPPTCLEGAHQ